VGSAQKFRIPRAGRARKVARYWQPQARDGCAPRPFEHGISIFVEPVSRRTWAHWACGVRPRQTHGWHSELQRGGDGGRGARRGRSSGSGPAPDAFKRHAAGPPRCPGSERASVVDGHLCFSWCFASSIENSAAGSGGGLRRGLLRGRKKKARGKSCASTRSIWRTGLLRVFLDLFFALPTGSARCHQAG